MTHFKSFSIFSKIFLLWTVYFDKNYKTLKELHRKFLEKLHRESLKIHHFFGSSSGNSSEDLWGIFLGKFLRKCFYKVLLKSFWNFLPKFFQKILQEFFKKVLPSFFELPFISFGSSSRIYWEFLRKFFQEFYRELFQELFLAFLLGTLHAILPKNCSSFSENSSSSSSGNNQEFRR